MQTFPAEVRPYSEAMSKALHISTAAVTVSVQSQFIGLSVLSAPPVVEHAN